MNNASSSNQISYEIRTTELCEITLLPTETVSEIVDYGILEPIGDSPANWMFNAEMVARARRAKRLHEDLDIDWPGIALALSLIEELEQLREVNRALEQRINRFHHW